jgi:hypothetical protein
MSLSVTGLLIHAVPRATRPRPAAGDFKTARPSCSVHLEGAPRTWSDKGLDNPYHARSGALFHSGARRLAAEPREKPGLVAPAEGRVVARGQLSTLALMPVAADAGQKMAGPLFPVGTSGVGAGRRTRQGPICPHVRWRVPRRGHHCQRIGGPTSPLVWSRRRRTPEGGPRLAHRHRRRSLGSPRGAVSSHR